MAKNRVTMIDHVFEAPVPDGTRSGDPVMVFDTIPAVAQTNEGGGVGNIKGRASVDTQGIHAFPCTDAVDTEGTAVYVADSRGDDGHLGVTTTANGDVYGYTIHLPNPEGRSGGTKTAGDGTINVRLAKA